MHGRTAAIEASDIQRGQPAEAIQADILSRARGLDFPAQRTAHGVIRGWLAELIGSGQLPKGTRLPAERAFSEAIGVSRMTLRQAMDSLQSSGYIERVVGRGGGSFVAQQRPTVDISDLMGLSPQLLRTAGTAFSTVLAVETARAPERVAEALELTAGAQAHRIRRIRFADEMPVALENSFFPMELFTDLPEQKLTGSLYKIMDSKYGHAPCSSVEELRPSIVSQEDAALLQLRPDALVLGIIRTSRSAAGTAVEYSEDILRTDRIRIMISGRVRNEAARPY